MRKITIEKLKNIKKLEFFIPEKNGVYILVGANGAGKTSLLVCLDRICNPYAFARGFPSSKSMKHIDTYSNATIQFDVDKLSVRFRKKNSKWAPTPKEGSKAILNKFDISETVLIKADSKRIEPKTEELISGKFVAVDNDIIDILNSIFETSKYDKLQQLRIGNGRGKLATTFYVIKEKGKYYYSEKRFSTGELAILRLVENINVAKPNTLFLLDEAEMALHPRIQKNLLDFLVGKSKELNLMVMLSTHSSTMIKSLPKENIILLSTKGDGKTEVIHPCYPARAIGSVDFEINTIYDAIFFVEDDMARIVLKKQIQRYIKIMANSVPEYSPPSYAIVPVGGYMETSRLSIVTKKQLFNHSKVFAVLDEDAFSEGLPNNNKFNELYEGHKDVIKTLGITPELWIIEQLEKGHEHVQDKMKEIFHCELYNIKTSKEYKDVSSNNKRRLAKKKLEIVLNIVKQYSGEKEDVIIEQLVELIVMNMRDQDVENTIAPLIKYI